MESLRHGQRALRSSRRVLHSHLQPRPLSSACASSPLPPTIISVPSGRRRPLSTDTSAAQPPTPGADQVEVRTIPRSILTNPHFHFHDPELKALNGLAISDATMRTLEALGARNFDEKQREEFEALKKRLEFGGGRRGDGGGGGGGGGGGDKGITSQPPLEETNESGYSRIVPVSASYFSRQASFNDAFVVLHQASVAHANLPRVSSADAERASWRSPKEWRLEFGEKVRAPDYSQAMELVRSLHRIHPRLKTPEVDRALRPFRRAVTAVADDVDLGILDCFGRSVGVGRRKASVATAWLVEGTGEVQVNGKSLADAFGRVHDRESVIWALHASRRVDKYNLWARVHGGGTTGQAEALTLAVAKALLVHEPGLKAALRRAGVVTRDWRRVERKKTGRVKARKRPAWVKR